MAQNLLAEFTNELGLGQRAKGQTLDPTAHVGNWSNVIGVGVVAVLAVICCIHQTYCKVAGRAVNDTDAPELEELGCLRQVDTVRVASGKLVTDTKAAGRAVRATRSEELAAAEDEEAAVRPRPKKKGARAKARS
eukprot:2756299-Prymnesium_polylepis.1